MYQVVDTYAVKPHTLCQHIIYITQQISYHKKNNSECEM